MKLILTWLKLYLISLYTDNEPKFFFDRFISTFNTPLFEDVISFIDLLNKLFEKDTEKLDTLQFSRALFEKMDINNSLIFK